MSVSVVTASTIKSSTCRGYRGVGDITIDLDGTLLTDIGWALFETGDDQLGGQGIIGTFNNYVTLTLIQFARTKRPCSIHGWFDDGKTGEHWWLLDDVICAGVLVRDVSGLIGFRASTVTCID